MDNYKIKVKDEAVFAEVVALCEQISGKSFPYPNISCDPDLWIFIGPEGAFGWSLDLDHSWSGLDLKELTLPQLRDLVVLKRNDVNDATHEDQYGDKWLYLDERHYVYLNDQWDLPIGEFLERYELKPILPVKKQDPALISGADALANVHKCIVQYLHDDEPYGRWTTITDHFWSQYHLGMFLDPDTKFKFRFKPQTIKLELEIPAPYKAKIGGRDDTSFVLNVGRHQYCYKTEEDYTKARDALEAVFDAAVRGTNS
ncbi:hypothetical protein A0120_RS05290 [Acinetobacter baumannii]|nr:hypothetical protein [Acinetobacter baumannii]